MSEKTEAAHTPGPWEVSDWLVIYADDGRMRVADVHGYDYLTGEWTCCVPGLAPEKARAIVRANAALIASAPDLAAQLDEARAIARELVEAGNKLYCLCPEGGSYTDEALERWDAALTRARKAGYIGEDG